VLGGDCYLLLETGKTGKKERNLGASPISTRSRKEVGLYRISGIGEVLSEEGGREFRAKKSGNMRSPKAGWPPAQSLLTTGSSDSSTGERSLN